MMGVGGGGGGGGGVEFCTIELIIVRLTEGFVALGFVTLEVLLYSQTWPAS